MKQYFAKIEMQCVGPINLQQVQKLVIAGHITPSTPISFDKVTFFEAGSLPEISFPFATEKSVNKIPLSKATSICQQCRGPMSFYESVCPNCGHDICQTGDDRMRKLDEGRFSKVNPAGELMDNTPGAWEAARQMDLDFDIARLTLTGWLLVVTSALASIGTMAFTSLVLHVTRENYPQYFLPLFAAAFLPAIIVFCSGRYVLHTSGFDITKPEINEAKSVKNRRQSRK
jgi:hypothetical protein